MISEKHFVSDPKALKQTIWDLILAGISTTAQTLLCLMNVLCQNPDIQQKLQDEIAEKIGNSRNPTMQDRDKMPYVKATLLEIGRYGSLVPVSLPHKAVNTCQLGGYTIPKDTPVWMNLWAMHHDEDLWEEPFKFKPERFLDEDGQVVDADHPNRKHLMPFSAGNRVCVGEVFAMTRMFLILTRILQNFTILPETTIEDQPSIDPRDMEMGFLIYPPDFKVRMVPL